MPKRIHAPIHPGVILKEEFLDELDLSQYALAKAINVPQPRIGAIVSGQRAISPDTALRLARFFGTSAEFWLNLQSHYDLEVTRMKSGKKIEAAVRPRAA